MAEKQNNDEEILSDENLKEELPQSSGAEIQ
jgi:hypothetical protein